MTQDVQPLTYQKRTNIEEHQQFFSKINEIIGSLAPTVDEAEKAIAQATAAIASANDAVATADAASAAASAAASQAQTAASTVAGYDNRLTAAEGDIDALQDRMGTAEAKNSQQDTAIASLQTADRQNVKINQVGIYAADLTSDQDVGGVKKMVGSRFRIYPASPSAVPYVEMKGQFAAGTPSTYQWFIQCRDKDDVEVGDLILSTDSNGNSQLSVALRKADGTTVTKIIATSV